jgi:hypothetical protein
MASFYYYVTSCTGGGSFYVVTTSSLLTGAVYKLNFGGSTGCYSVATGVVTSLAQSATVVSGPWQNCSECLLDATPTPTPTNTPTNTVTPTITMTSTVTPTKTVTPSVTPTKTVTPTVTITVTPTKTTTPTPSPTPYGIRYVNAQYAYGTGQTGSFSGGTWDPALFGTTVEHPTDYVIDEPSRTAYVVDLSAIRIGSGGYNN